MSLVSKLLETSRIKKKYKKSEVADKLAFSGQFYGRIEKGEVALPLPKALIVCSFLDIDPNRMALAYSKDYERYVLEKMGLI